MTDHKKKGDFHKTDSHAEREGGNKKNENPGNDANHPRRGGNPGGHGGHK